MNEKSTTSVISDTSTTNSNPSAQKASGEHRQVYGTAKTENLRDSGLWRIILPSAIGLFCLTLFIVPLLILVPLLMNSIAGITNHNPQEAQLLWIWITMIAIEIAICTVITRGFC